MKRVDHPAAVSLGLVVLTSIALTSPLVSHTHDAVYHLPGSAAVLFIPVLLDVCALWLILWLLLWLGQRSPVLEDAVWGLLLCASPLVVLKNWVLLTERTISREAWMWTALLPMVVLACAGLCARRGTGEVLGRVRPIVELVLGACSFFGIFILLQLMWFGWQARDLNSAPILHCPRNLARGEPPHTRVVWIVLDELSYQQVYEQRFSGLELPAFDQLAAEATVFTHAGPAGDRTELVVPALLTGVSVDGLDVRANGRLRALHDPSTGKWRGFDAQQTVFSDALELGYSTGVAGWYNPYCRVLAEVLDHCFWASRMGYAGHMFGARTVASNAMGPLTWFAERFRRYVLRDPNAPEPGADRAAMHLADYRGLVEAGDHLLADPSCDFVFLHLPIPHPGGIFNRRREEFATRGGSYIDNLVLADGYLAHVRKLLEAQGEWDRSTVLVMGDHSWRTKGWMNGPEWTAEDQAASHGGAFDDRPAYLVKLPRQHQGGRIDTAFAAIRTRALIDAILKERLRTATELQDWVNGPDPR